MSVTVMALERTAERLRELWERHVPRETIYDLWEYRTAFLRPGYEPLFIHAKGGLLPLWREPDGWLSFFGGFYCERNRLPARAEVLLALLEEAGAPVDLPYLTQEPPRLPGLRPYTDVRYELAGVDWPSYLTSFRVKRRRQIRHYEEITVVTGTLADLEEGLAWNVANQVARGRESLFADAGFRAGFLRMVAALSALGVGHVLLLRRAGGEVVGVQAVANYRGTITLLNGGHKPGTGAGNAVIRATLAWALGRRPRTVDWMTDRALTFKQTHWHFRPVTVWGATFRAT